ncbi:MAG: ferritin family protein [Planctomycetes bacterium]|nr:ferritin family protein [Planctomycetota bacterium]
MAGTFNADEVFEMAEEIERNGIRFYHEASTKAADKEMKQMLQDMAVMEEGHLKTFEGMRRELSDEEKGGVVFDPYNEGAVYLQMMAGLRGSEGKVSPSQKLSGNETIKEILEIAVDAEKESIVFYSGLKNMVPVTAGRDKVEAIIAEEMGHVNSLLEQLKKFE